MAGYISILVVATQLYEQITSQKHTAYNYKGFHYPTLLTACLMVEAYELEPGP